MSWELDNAKRKINSLSSSLTSSKRKLRELKELKSDVESAIRDVNSLDSNVSDVNRLLGLNIDCLETGIIIKNSSHGGGSPISKLAIELESEKEKNVESDACMSIVLSELESGLTQIKSKITTTENSIDNLNDDISEAKSDKRKIERKEREERESK